ncbi:urease accessory protein UreF [Rhizobium leguminosarum bv. trifolii CB782]|uniref:Urease accessory protein UreF n=1 Tax=Rhizobium hidalgonense TaxID=1538159 RepID=A0AAJ2GW55_9HYPH|nr:urease accessory protein UreF [Rhizobium hidalgonense]AHG46572.1 urease accessory protein UreF [Rhizobium leguminosarum bv. trifolii CB782]MDR9773608.1 urease accessory protein UreF [Rhizobium hidalgonense]MDR9807344.1 urease accessory protein UreF [Rhizobium hidalgonense]MDR9811087.1 urease accessory protein UreF [Rhizobium hidalgonense]MDR9819371.1 urease accessory protein UreF [Rhizobium hidalgonense]
MTGDPELQALLRLTAWLSPAFPIGSFAYSGGLERAVADGLVTDASSLAAWIGTLTGDGSVWNDAVLLAQSYRHQADAAQLAEIAALAAALAGSRERHQETMLLGEAFLAAARAWPDDVFERLPKQAAYPIAVGAVTGAHGIGLEKALAAFLHAYASQAVSSGIRLGVAGQKDGVAVLAGLEQRLTEVARRAAASTLDDLGSATVQADIASLRHETQATRLFRS